MQSISVFVWQQAVVGKLLMLGIPTNSRFVAFTEV